MERFAAAIVRIVAVQFNSQSELVLSFALESFSVETFAFAFAFFFVLPLFYCLNMLYSDRHLLCCYFSSFSRAGLFLSFSICPLVALSECIHYLYINASIICQ